jgi:hypothetical protein
MKRFFCLFSLFSALSSTTFAGRPVYHDLKRHELMARSNFVFSGWPSTAAATGGCKHELGRWWVHKVYQGNKTLEGKVISIAQSNYQIYATEGKPPSFQAFRYKKGNLDRVQGTTFLFTMAQTDGCYELAADGAQESSFAELEIEALYADASDCGTIERGFGFRTKQLPVDCKADSDCKTYYAHPDACHKPYVWNKSAESKLDDEFIALQNRTRVACGATWNRKTPCAPTVIPVRCRAEHCEEGNPPRIHVGPLVSAKLEGSCAPHDAASILISGKGAKDFPTLSINWWGTGNPGFKSGTFILTSRDSAETQGFQIYYCEFKEGCPTVENLELKLIWDQVKGEGKMNFSFTADGKKVSGSIPVKSEPNPMSKGCG